MHPVEKEVIGMTPKDLDNGNQASGLTPYNNASQHYNYNNNSNNNNSNNNTNSNNSSSSLKE